MGLVKFSYWLYVRSMINDYSVRLVPMEWKRVLVLVRAESWADASVSRLSHPRPRHIFRIRVASFASFVHPTRMHSVNAMGEDTTVLKKAQMRMR